MIVPVGFLALVIAYFENCSKTITVATTPSGTGGVVSGLKKGATVTATATLSSTPGGDVKAYRVQIAKLGIDDIVYGSGGTLVTDAGSVVVNGDITVAATDIVVTAVPAVSISSITWTPSEMTITFNRGVTLKTATPMAVKTSANGVTTLTSTGESTTTAATTIKFTPNTGKVFTAGDDFDLTNAAATGYKDEYTYEIATGVIKLNADGTGTYTKS